MRLVCHRGICSKTHIEEGRKKKIELLKESSIMFVFFFFKRFFLFLNPGFALIVMNTHVICCILSNTLVLKQLGCFFTASEESLVVVSDTFLDCLTL